MAKFCVAKLVKSQQYKMLDSGHAASGPCWL